ncbi:MAG: hypothetical protein AAGI38_13060 [Bacteroidota bacterium]
MSWNLSLPNQSLSPEGANEVSIKLDQLLVDMQVFRQNIRTINWSPNIRPHFDLAPRVNQLYGLTAPGPEIVANRILELGHEPANSNSEVLMKASLQTKEEIRTYEEAIFVVIRNSHQLLKDVKEVFDTAATYKDEKTMGMMQEFAQYLNHTIWLFTSLRAARMN